MPIPLNLLLAVHVAAALLWMGSSFIVAMNKGVGAEQQYRLQNIAALVVFGTGGSLWQMLHWPLFGPMEMVLAAGSVCAVAAAGFQGALVGGSLRRMRQGVLGETEARQRITKGQRLAAGLIAVGLLCMAGAHLARRF